MKTVRKIKLEVGLNQQVDLPTDAVVLSIQPSHTASVVNMFVAINTEAFPERHHFDVVRSEEPLADSDLGHPIIKRIYRGTALAAGHWAHVFEHRDVQPLYHENEDTGEVVLHN